MCAEGQEPTVLVKESPHPDRFGVCIVDDQGYLKNVLEKKPNPPSNLVNIGVYLLNRDIFDVPKVKLPGGEYNLSEQISSWASKAKIKVLEARFWQPVGYLEDLPIAEQLLQTLAGTRTD
ncbi:MAG: hypothetical protein A2Y84_01050 [Candidatus Colwellbacteria bacterium RBG_13_48_8]|uniref:Nucleotidyl transferase domain-containing protein n=1 Tax=Candidatus Colwellbacteria bacterium RBG_13_48_8 TaxID=1797685 RepID=A0A1G1YY26_9BACT|nr:MAG: hypothetical protein A2Y84_01050 [Candidatus Colwellbacteria bacterium RBG_13_48_8]